MVVGPREVVKDSGLGAVTGLALPNRDGAQVIVGTGVFSHDVDLGRRGERPGCAEAEASIREYIEIFYNRQRRHSCLGNVAPAVFAQSFRIQQRTA